jgi:A/G-specific adenine glycosylase
MPWRSTVDPYKIFVSEIMLQQTQVVRVIPKYEAFVLKFPSFKSLANARTGKVLELWSGLGYNRRALNLQRAAKIVTRNWKGVLPPDIEELDRLPGVGPATAAALYVYAFNRPAAYVETNIRTVFLHFFFNNKKKISDKAILGIVMKTVDHTEPREWYYALMDYGAKLKSEIGNQNRRSKHYVAQSKFKGSNREVRGAILKIITSRKKMELSKIFKLPFAKSNIKKNILALEAEGFFKLTKTGVIHG